MLHTTVGGSVMLPSISDNLTLRTLQPDDLAGIRNLYPAGGVSDHTIALYDIKTNIYFDTYAAME